MYIIPESIINWDKHLLLAINHCHSPWTDQFFWLISGPLLPIVLGISLLFFLFKDNGIRTFWYLLFLALTILLADNISSSLFKPLVERLRPTHDPSLMKLIHTVHGYTGGLYGFVSSHAANTFGAALFTSLLLRNRRLSFVFFAWAILTSYSRMYLGVHFPLDILGGMVVGLLSGAFCYLLMELLSPKIFNRSNLPASPYFPAKERSYFLWIATAVFVFVVIKSFF